MKKNKGFTLIELIVVMAIIAMLCSIIVPNYKGYRAKVSQKKVIAISEQIADEILNVYCEKKSEKECPKDTYNTIQTCIENDVKKDIGIDVSNVIYTNTDKNKNIKLIFSYESKNYDLSFDCRTYKYILKSNGKNIFDSQEGIKVV